MKKSTDNPMATAAELLAERRKYEGWLAALDARRASTPEHVFTRVRADYEARLDAVVAQLTTRAGALDARVAELTARAATLQDDARTIEDERAEAELRAHVGELEAPAWEEASRAAAARLEALAAEGRTVEQELASIRELISAARSPTPAQARAAIEPPPRRPASAEPEPSAGDAMDVIAQAGARSEQHDAFAGQEQVAPAPEGAAGGDAPLVTEPAPPERDAGGFDELAFLRDVTGVSPANGMDAPAKQPAAAREPAPEPEPVPERPIDDTLGLVLPDDRAALTPPRRPSTETPLAANVSGNSPIVLHGDAKQAKTLKCSDCGSMNYPTEWYCERCGAELSAL